MSSMTTNQIIKCTFLRPFVNSKFFKIARQEARASPGFFQIWQMKSIAMSGRHDYVR